MSYQLSMTYMDFRLISFIQMIQALRH